jgi:acyl-CoA synthetase (AMP-forming)/AMP-acid ligase II
MSDQTTDFIAAGVISSDLALLEPLGGYRLTYGELEEVVDHIARQLLGLGVEPGTRVGLLAQNGLEVVCAFLGVLAAGGVAVPVNPALRPGEIGDVLDALGPALMLVDSKDAALAVASVCADRGVAIHFLTGEPRPAIAHVTAATTETVDSGPDAVSLLLQTSGTTSRPKTVPLRRRNLIASARNIAAGYGLDGQDVTYCVMPLFHIHGLVGVTLSTLSSGGTLVVPRRGVVSRFLAHAESHAVTWVSAVPTIMAKLVPRGEASGALERTRSLRFGRTSSSALPIELIQRFEAAFEVPIVEAYGMTEASHQMASNPLPPGERRAGTVGLATGTEVAIVDEDWREQPTGASGEVVVRGPGVIDGYLDNQDANASSFRDGWFRTGDLGVLSGDRYLTLVGRIKELINRGGEKIAPREIDETLLRHTGVLEAVAYGVSDAKYGEIVHAAVVLDTPTDVEELLAHCAQRLAPYKVPAKIRVLEAIPKGPTGKVQRTSLAKILEG